MATTNELYDEAMRSKDEGNLDDAVAKLNAAIAADADYALAHAALSVVYQKMGKHTEAVEHAQKVCKIEPTEPFSFTAMSVTCQRAYAGTGDQSFIQMAEDAMAKSHLLESD